ncbi:MAG: succinate dehydrogenase, hydrophobic membrane anchor protein [SAR86 cluster bacterium]|uniref:Succinate dehydrogenase hydrophobic membrane anchor subunit n=1 Tax=SAR86 cluster bacterium TaxID=2030880 RepID=A0A520N1C0_9GAMM|nr:succinate dehydrogenase, hydrophobic membrane anchor protein [SAR86 cluster bacterium]RZO27279.1 MAG: succinate dehydrogenase, hydrophobic membrane anchor protein [SAR86 cluster bacterium]
MVMGTSMWYIQRFTSIIILAYVLFMLFSYLAKSYSENPLLWVNDIGSMPIKVFTILFVVSLFTHSLLGLKAVEDDYLSKRTLGFVSLYLAQYAQIFRFIYRFFVALVIFVLTYILIFNYIVS